MKIEKDKTPRNPINNEGFPRLGLVSTITTQFLIDNLKAIQIGKFILEEVPPIIAVQRGEIIEPIGIFYASKYDLVIINAITNVSGYEWQIAKLVVELAKMLKAKEILCIEGIGSPNETDNVFYLTNKEKNVAVLKKKTGLHKLQDGIIMGVTGALVLHRSILTSCFFVETHSNLPDSRAAAKIIEILDRYIGLKLDPKPLIEQAEKFEAKIKDVIEKSKSASEMKQQKELSYLG